MGPARRFEELIAWQMSTELCEMVFSLTESGKCLRDPEFREQIRRAAENAPALIAEGFIRFTPNEFVGTCEWPVASSAR
jgi:four helix bundle protein